MARAEPGRDWIRSMRRRRLAAEFDNIVRQEDLAAWYAACPRRPSIWMEYADQGVSVPLWESGELGTEEVGGVGTMEAREIRRLFFSAIAASTAMIEASGLLSNNVVSGGGGLVCAR